MHGFVAYFECAFSHSHKPVVISTCKIFFISVAPYSKYTHWKQTVFYNREAVSIKMNEEIKGKISCCRNKKNPRDLDVLLDYEFNGSNMSLKEHLTFLIR